MQTEMGSHYIYIRKLWNIFKRLTGTLEHSYLINDITKYTESFLFFKKNKITSVTTVNKLVKTKRLINIMGKNEKNKKYYSKIKEQKRKVWQKL